MYFLFCTSYCYQKKIHFEENNRNLNAMDSEVVFSTYERHETPHNNYFGSQRCMG